MDPQYNVNQPYQVKTSEYINEAWNIFKGNASTFILAIVVVLLVNILLSVIPILGQLASIVIGPVLGAGLYWMAYKASIGEKPELADLKIGFDFVLPLVLYSIISGILISIGFVLLIIPGIYLAVSYLFVNLLIVNNRLDFWDAMETSRKVVTNNWFSVFFFGLSLFLIMLLGALALGVGLLVAIPVSIIAISVAYRDIFVDQLNMKHETAEAAEPTAS